MFGVFLIKDFATNNTQTHRSAVQLAFREAQQLGVKVKLGAQAFDYVLLECVADDFTLGRWYGRLEASGVIIEEVEQG